MAALTLLQKRIGVSLPNASSGLEKAEAIKLHEEQTGLDVEDATADVEAFLADKH
jgi:hypothetical protein